MPEWEDTTGVTNPGEATNAGEFERDRPCLVVLSGLHLGQIYSLKHDAPQTVGRSRSASIRLVDEGVSRKHVTITAGDAELESDGGDDGRADWWLEDLRSRNGTFCNGNRIDRHKLRDGDKIQLGRNTMLRFTFVDVHDENFQRLMYDSALRDGLTRIFNRRYFTDRVRAELRFAERHNTRLALLMFDLDGFRAINEAHGRVAGDFVLTEFVDAIQRRVRSEDVFARFGGEEFALLTRAITTAHAAQLAERLRCAIESMTLCYQGEPIRLTTSVGLACFPDVAAADPDELIAAGGRALYSAKEHGRNCIAVYHPDPEPSLDGEWPTEEPLTQPE